MGLCSGLLGGLDSERYKIERRQTSDAVRGINAG